MTNDDLDDRKLVMLSMRITRPEYDRLKELIRKAKRRTLGYAPMTDVLRELLGLTPYRLVSEADRESLLPHGPYLRKEKESER